MGNFRYDEDDSNESNDLLEEYESQGRPQPEKYDRLSRGVRRATLPVLFAFSLVLNAMFTMVGVYLYRRAAPAQDILSYEVVKFNSAFGVGRSEYQGEPSPELDELWENLFLLELQIPREQARLLPNKTIPVHPDKPDSFAVGLSVFHDLHCLNTIRKGLDYFNYQMWNETHNPLNTPLHLLDDDHRLGGPLDPPHLSHCIDHLRQAIQCHSDISPVVWQWSEATQDNKIYGTTVRTCRNFAAVRDWATEHDYSKIIYSPEKPEELGLCGAFDQGCGY
ncbi:hypothetical protein PG996_008293 [Apiospora saccharicola]|uniref:Tat pathway signal sequence n=1 Tax=Apiospora saccharicola TaxID=335842 RepID=A0ABR1UXH1_9PEZI